MHKRPILGFLLWLWLPFLSPIAADEPVVEGSHVARIQASGKLVLRAFPQIDSPFVTVLLGRGPMKSVGDQKDFGGVDVAILSHLAKRLKVDLEVRPISEPLLPLLFEALREGTGDISGGGLTITPERRKKVLFSKGYVDFYDTVVVRADHYPEIEDLPSLRLAVLRGSSFDDRFKHLGLAEERYARLDFNTGSVDHLISRSSDVAFFDSCAMPEEAGHSLRAAYRFDGVSYLGFALPLASDLKPILDEVIDELESSGRLKEILDEGLPQQIEAKDLPVVRAEDFCAEPCGT